jgi:hypothetical protein
MPLANTSHRKDRNRDEALKETFPASDAPASGGITGPEGAAKPSHKRPIEERPTGTPNSDRHAAETAHHPEDKDPTAE